MGVGSVNMGVETATFGVLVSAQHYISNYLKMQSPDITLDKKSTLQIAHAVNVISFKNSVAVQVLLRALPTVTIKRYNFKQDQ